MRALLCLLTMGCLYISPDDHEARLEGMGVGEEVDADADTDADTESDGDADADTDADADADADTDTDGDEDGDGYLARDDCDDGDPAVNPGASESCATAWDDDCDGNDNDSDAAGCTVYYEDADGDLYGSSVSSCLCRPEGAFVSETATDCDDADSTVNPGATEVCDDGVDQDCDGAATGCWRSGTTDLTAADATLNGESGGDYAGTSVWAGDLDGDGQGDILVGSGNGSGGTSAGAAYAVYGPASGSVSLSAADSKLVGEDSFDGAGAAVIGGDFDGDGVGDALVGAALEDGGGSDGGAVYLVSGALAGTVDLSAADAKLIGSTGQSAGSALWGGDLDGDGVDDCVVGAPYTSGGGSYSGAAHVVPGPLSGLSGLTYVDAALLYGEGNNDQAGQAVWGGDLDGDGVGDAVIGAYGEDAGGAYAGAAYLVLGPFSGNESLSSADAKLGGEDGYDFAGFSVSGGDFDEDGRVDAVVGAFYEDAGGIDAGAAYVVLGPTSGFIDLSAADAKLTGEAGGDQAGRSVWGGDLDGGGADDILVGALIGDAVYGVLGPISGTFSLATADAEFRGDGGDQAGRAVWGADMNGDLSGDALIGATTAGSNTGAVYLFLGTGM